MKHQFMRNAWAAVCAAAVGAMATLTAFAEEPAQRSTKVMLSMDVIQTVSLIVVIFIVVVILAVHIAKMVLKKMHIPPKEHDEEQNKEE